jgi:hypothetical protein
MVELIIRLPQETVSHDIRLQGQVIIPPIKSRHRRRG